MDAFAVAMTIAMTLPKFTCRHGFRLIWHFGLFQALMPALSWFSGNTIRNYISAYDHWVAFILLSIVGIRMIIDAFKEEKNYQTKDPTRGFTLVALATATSIDALAVGFTFSLLKTNILTACLMIGVITAAITGLGILLGLMLQRVQLLKKITSTLGGALLIAIGTKILWEHHVFDVLK
ncbi:MAG: manganese efflux pump [Deltaproteobacteria bacterium]|nr:manganese efflux pump [Deltaproteobacteria bacterium]